LENERVLPEPEPAVWFTEFADNSLNFTLVAWFANTGDRWTGMIELRYEIDRLFREHDIEIPFPQRTLTFKSDSPVPLQATAESREQTQKKAVPPPAPPRASQQVDVEGIDEE
jgi:small-conductance mechanosensitive channel